MATILNTTQVYAAADVVTHTNLNQIVGGTTFVAGDGGATDNTSLEVNTTSGSLQIKDNGVTTAKLLNSTDTTDGVTLPKIQHIDTAKVLGRTSTGEGNVEEVDIVIGATGDSGVFFDNDDMLDNSDTAGGSATRGATQQSIKAYVDGKGITQTTGTAPYYGVRAWCHYNGSSQVIQAQGNIASVTRHGAGDYEFFFSTAMPSSAYAISLSYSNEVSVQHGVGFVVGHSTTSFRVQHYNAQNSNNRMDKAYVGVSVIG